MSLFENRSNEAWRRPELETSLIGKALTFGFREYRFKSYVSNRIVYFKNTYILLLNRLKLAFIKNNFFFTTKPSKFLFNFLQILYRLKIVHRFYLIKKGHYKVFPNYNKHGYFSKNIKNYYRLKNPVILKKKTLSFLSQISGNTHFILETSKGLVTHQEALSLDIGGILVCIIY